MITSSSFCFRRRNLYQRSLSVFYPSKSHSNISGLTASVSEAKCRDVNRFTLLPNDSSIAVGLLETLAEQEDSVPVEPPLEDSGSNSEAANAVKPRRKLYFWLLEDADHSKRVNRTRVVTGNNKLGRKGKRRCALCRKRHSPVRAILDVLD